MDENSLDKSSTTKKTIRASILIGIVTSIGAIIWVAQPSNNMGGFVVVICIPFLLLAAIVGGWISGKVISASEKSSSKFKGYSSGRKVFWGVVITLCLAPLLLIAFLRLFGIVLRSFPSSTP